MKKISIIIFVLAIIIGGAYYYLTKPVASPSEPKEINYESADGMITYAISPEESEASFAIDEILNGKDFTAVGITKDIKGSILVNLADISKIQVKDVSVNARTLKTDSKNRDGAIARFILKSEDAQNEFITFVPKSITGLPEAVVFESEVSFSITGDLTVSGVIKEVTFNGKIKELNAEKLVAEAETIVKRSDFNLVVPDLAFLASVDDEVRLKLFITAKPIN